MVSYVSTKIQSQIKTHRNVEIGTNHIEKEVRNSIFLEWYKRRGKMEQEWRKILVGLQIYSLKKKKNWFGGIIMCLFIPKKWEWDD